MSRITKFRAWDHFNAEMFYSGSEADALSKFFRDVTRRRKGGNWVTVMQFTGLLDKNGAEIYEEDVVNIYFTSSDHEHNHDCLYKVNLTTHKGIEFSFVKLLWESFGHNQYPSSTRLGFYNRSMDNDFRNENYDSLAVVDSREENYLLQRSWKANDYSNYIEKVGNVHENPEMLEEQT